MQKANYGRGGPTWPRDATRRNYHAINRISASVDTLPVITLVSPSATYAYHSPAPAALFAALAVASIFGGACSSAVQNWRDNAHRTRRWQNWWLLQLLQLCIAECITEAAPLGVKCPNHCRTGPQWCLYREWRAVMEKKAVAATNSVNLLTLGYICRYVGLVLSTQYGTRTRTRQMRSKLPDADVSALIFLKCNDVSCVWDACTSTSHRITESQTLLNALLARLPSAWVIVIIIII